MTVPFELTPGSCPQGSGESPGSFEVQSGLTPTCITPGNFPTPSGPGSSLCLGEFWAEITDVDDNGAYSWKRVLPQSGGEWEDGEETGDPCNNPAYEVNGVNNVANGTRVRMYLALTVEQTELNELTSGSCPGSGLTCEYRFEYCCAS